MLDILFGRFQKTIKWPEREQLIETAPMCFRELFGKHVATVIDCFEVFVNRPSNLKARAQTWSSYAHHNTAKFLLGTCPQGVISYRSRAWGCRASDKLITENCGIPINSVPGDYVLADRGFEIEDSVGFYCVQLNLPAFTKGKAQRSATDVEKSRNKYSILQTSLPVDHIIKVSNGYCTIDKILTVCCAFCNLCPTVVPSD